MIRKSGYRFSEKTMLHQDAGASIDSIQNNLALAAARNKAAGLALGQGARADFPTELDHGNHSARRS
jgi:hypothetical protein